MVGARPARRCRIGAVVRPVRALPRHAAVSMHQAGRSGGRHECRHSGTLGQPRPKANRQMEPTRRASRTIRSLRRAAHLQRYTGRENRTHLRRTSGQSWLELRRPGTWAATGRTSRLFEARGWLGAGRRSHSLRLWLFDGAARSRHSWLRAPSRGVEEGGDCGRRAPSWFWARAPFGCESRRGTGSNAQRVPGRARRAV